MHVRQEIEDLLGKDVYKDGVYQTKLVAQRVFSDPALLSQLNKIVHPAVKADILRWQAAHDKEDKQLLFVECAILYQAGFDKLCDHVVAITAPEEIRIQRTMVRDHTSMDKVLARMRVQNTENALQVSITLVKIFMKSFLPLQNLLILCSQVMSSSKL